MVVALICARGGSKGVPGKNIRPLAGRPLIAWAITHAQAVAGVDRVIISTDSEEIAAAARQEGAEVPFRRPADISGDDTPEWLVWRHALNHLRESGTFPHAMMIVPATAPLRAVADLERCLDEYRKGGADVIVTVTEAHRSPYFNMVTMGPGDIVSLVIPPERTVSRRQDAQIVYDMTTVGYVVRPDYLLSHEGIFEGRVRAVHVPPERALDIDTTLDFKIAEYLMAMERSGGG